MSYTIRIRRDSAANWSSLNPILEEGELGHELDTLQMKIGDGVTAWNDLDYLPMALQGPEGPAGPPGTGDGMPDATGVPDGKFLATQDEAWVIVDAPSGTGDPGTGGTFRGTWGNEYLAWADDFSDDSFVDAPWAHQIAPVRASVGVRAVAGAIGGATQPGYTKTAYVRGDYTTDAGVFVELDLALLDIPNITRIKFWSASFNGSNGPDVTRTIQKNAVSIAGFPTTSGGFWSEYDLVADSDDKFLWAAYNDPFGVVTTADGRLYLAGVRVYATTEPYMFNDVVAKDGLFYRSITDNNVTTPGVDASWELISGATTAGSMVYKGAYTSGGGHKGDVVDYGGFMWLCLSDTATAPVAGASWRSMQAI